MYHTILYYTILYSRIRCVCWAAREFIFSFGVFQIVGIGRVRLGFDEWRIFLFLVLGWEIDGEVWRFGDGFVCACVMSFKLFRRRC